MKNRVELVVVGTSAGGVTTLQKLFQKISSSFEIPIVVVLHMPANAVVDFSLIFGSFTRCKVLEAEDKLKLEPKCIYFATPGYHVLVEKGGSLALSLDDAVHFSRPSIDVLFESAAEAYGEHLVGILLTGANGDGAAGLEKIKTAKGYTIVQNPATAEVRIMPEQALAKFTPSAILDLDEISAELSRFGDRQHVSDQQSGGGHAS